MKACGKDGEIMKILGKGKLCDILFDLFINIGLVIILFISVYPFIYVISISISDSWAIAMGDVYIIPKGFQMDAYKDILRDNTLMRAYYNTTLYAVSGTALALLLNSLTAYALSIESFILRKPLSFIFVITILFSGGIIPLYLVIVRLGIHNTIWAIILPVAVEMWYVVLIRTNFKEIPGSLRESAFIDGASHWRVLFQIILPMSKPILATIVLFCAVDHWNRYFRPLLFLNDPKKFPLQVVLKQLIVDNSARGEGLELAQYEKDSAMISMSGYLESLKMAGIMVSIGPIILVYPYIQKYFMKGILVGAVKG